MHRLNLCLALMASAGLLCAQVDVLTANYDNNRTNGNLNETILNLNNVNPTQFGKLYSFPVDGEVYAQPLYAHGLSMPGKGTLNVLYVATMHNSVYAFDADATSGTAPLWHVNLGSPINPASFNIAGAAPYSDILNEIGILSTPVIDRTGGTIYVVDETLVNGSMAFYLHALDITSGSEKLNGPVQIQASVEGDGWGGSGDSVNGQLSLIASDHLQRTGLLLANGTVYIGFGSHGDYAPWHGWIVAYSAADLQQTAVFNTTPSAAGSSIWQGGRGLAADADGSVYCSTGNGNFDGVVSWGETVLRFTPTLDIADWFTPSEYADWTDDDQDYGSNGPILVPGTNLLIAGGKAGLVALIDRTNMGHQASDAEAVQVFQSTGPTKFAIFNAALWGLPADPILYVWAFNDALREYQMQNGTFNTTPLATNTTASNALPFSGMTVSSNGAVPWSGILWATTVAQDTLPSAGTLHAFNALEVGQELWNSNMEGTRDTLGNFTKFANPTVANGKVYVPTASGQVVVYGLLPVPGVTAVVNAASFSSYTVAPGELITIFGNSIGPAAPLGAVVNAQGKVSTSLAGHTVTFDGVAAPLLYAAAGQINAIVPFSVAGKASALMRVSDFSGASYSVTLPVSATAPATFTISPAGQGAILNGDLSVNSGANPAARGAWISIYATGAGVLSPPVDDGTLIADGNLPQAVAPVTVTIGGLPATLNYQGGAPGLVAGVMQINAQVPPGVAPGPAVPVTISAGGTAGLNTVTVAVK